MTSDSAVRIALLESDAVEAMSVQSWLCEAGFNCTLFQSVDSLQFAMCSQIFDVIIIDWFLCVGGNGLDVLSWLRAAEYQSDVSVIVTSESYSERSLVTALYSGADLYLSKPLRQRELLARVQVLVRRTRPRSEIISCPPYMLDKRNREVRCENMLVSLTNLEYQLTVFLFSNRGRVLSREHLLLTVWGKPATLNTRTVDAHICRLRTKLKLTDTDRWMLTSVHRRGYCLEEQSIAV